MYSDRLRLHGDVELSLERCVAFPEGPLQKRRLRHLKGLAAAAVPLRVPEMPRCAHCAAALLHLTLFSYFLRVLQLQVELLAPTMEASPVQLSSHEYYWMASA